MSSPSLSLIIPSFNHAKYLKDLMGSIFGGETCLGNFSAQTLLPDEIVIVDDCSEDNTQEVVADLLKLHKEIKYLRLKHNSGTAIACNEAIKISSGEIITRIDSDDMRESWSFKDMMTAQLLYPHSYIYDNMMIFLNGNKTGKTWVMNDYDFDLLIKSNINHAGIMFPKIAWEESGGYPEEFSNGRDDWSFNVALGVVGYCGIHIGGAGYLYRREQQNRSVKNSSSEFQMLYDRKMRAHFPDVYSGRFPMSCCGHRSSSGNSNRVGHNSGSHQTLLIGAEGMTMVRYNGSNYGKETYFGPATGASYAFSVDRNIRNVDNRDLRTSNRTGLLDIVEKGINTFSIYSNPQVKKEEIIKSSPVIESEPEPEVESKPLDTVEAGKTPMEKGQNKFLTVSKLKKLADSGLNYWEQFVSESSVSLSSITGLSVTEIEAIKKEVTE